MSLRFLKYFGFLGLFIMLLGLLIIPSFDRKVKGGINTKIFFPSDIFSLSPDNFGYSGSGTGEGDIYNTIRGSWFAAPKDGKVENIVANVFLEQGVHCKYAIYRKSDGVLLAYTEEAFQTQGWVNLSVISPPLVKENENYWLVAWGEQGATLFYTTTGATNKGGYESETYNSFPSSFSPTSEDKKYRIYAEYIPLEEKVQDFKNYASDDENAWEGEDSTETPNVEAPNISGETPALHADFLGMENKDDASFWDTSLATTDQYYDYQYYKFPIDETISGMEAIEIEWEGYGTDAAANLFIYENNDGTWDWEKLTSGGNGSEAILSFTVTENFNNYIYENATVGENQIWLAASAKYVVESCPILYTWNGKEYEQIWEINASGGLGFFPRDMVPYPYQKPYALLSSVIEDEQLNPDNGFYKIRITEELNEIGYLDSINLQKIYHPKGTRLFTNIPILNTGEWDKTSESPWFFVVSNIKEPIEAWNDKNENILEQIRWDDNIWTDRGTAGIWDNLIFDFGDLSNAERLILIFKPEVDWYEAMEATHYVAYIEIWNGSTWERVDELIQSLPEAGGPDSYPQMPQALDITDWFPENITEYKLRFNDINAKKYDYVWIATGPEHCYLIENIPLLEAELYQQKAIPSKFEGFFTKYGDVLELVSRGDDKFVIMDKGDAIDIKFEATSNLILDWLVELGLIEKSYVVLSEAYYKPNKLAGLTLSGPPLQVTPLPFKEMTCFPYPENESFPWDNEHLEWWDEYQTRYIEAEGHGSLKTEYVTFTIYGEWGLPPVASILFLPENNSVTDNTPSFEWTIGDYTDNNRILIDNDSNFSTPEENHLLGGAENTWSKTAPGFVSENYYWKVIALNSFGSSSSTIRVFEVGATVITGESENEGKDNADICATIDYADYDNVQIRFLHKSNKNCYAEQQDTTWDLDNHQWTPPSSSPAPLWGQFENIAYIAAVDSSEADKAAADNVCDGDNDQDTIEWWFDYFTDHYTYNEETCIYLYDGTYYLHDTLVLHETNFVPEYNDECPVSLWGESRENTILLSIATPHPAYGVAAINHNQAPDSWLRDFTLKGTKTLGDFENEWSGIHFYKDEGSDDVHIKNVTIQNFGAIGIYIETSALDLVARRLTRIYIENCIVMNTGNTGLTSAHHMVINNPENNRMYDLQIWDCTFINCGIGSDTYNPNQAIKIGGSNKKIRVCNNTFENCGIGAVDISCSYQTQNPTEDVLIQGNKFRRNDTRDKETENGPEMGAVLLQGTSTKTLSDVTIRGNDFDAFYAIRWGNGYMDGVTIENNNYYNTVIPYRDESGSNITKTNNDDPYYSENYYTTWEVTSLENYCKYIDNLYWDDIYGERMVGFRAELKNGAAGGWTTYYSLLREAPVLISPENNEQVSDNTPTFKWISEGRPSYCQIMIDNDFNYSSPILTKKVNWNDGEISYTSENELPYENYVWKVEDDYISHGKVSENFFFEVIPNYPPTIEALSITDVSNVEDYSLDVDTQYKLWIEIGDNDTIEDIEEVHVRVFENTLVWDSADNVRNHLSFKWVRHGVDNWFEVGPDNVSPYDHLIVENCYRSPENDLALKDNFIFVIKLPIVATPLNSWNVQIKVIDNWSAAENTLYQNKFSVNIYSSISFSVDNITFMGYPGEDNIPAWENPVLDNITSNTNFNLRVRLTDNFGVGENIWINTDNVVAGRSLVTTSWVNLYSNQDWGEDIQLDEWWWVDIPEDAAIGRYTATFEINVQAIT